MCGAQRAGAPAALHRADLSPEISAEGRVLPGPSPEPTERPTPFGAELGACSSTPRAWERTQERRRPAPAPRAAEPPLRTLEPSSPPPRQPLGSATKVWISEERASVGTQTGLFWTSRKELSHCLSTLPAPPGLGSCQRPWGGQDCGLHPHPPTRWAGWVPVSVCGLIQLTPDPQGAPWALKD